MDLRGDGGVMIQGVCVPMGIARVSNPRVGLREEEQSSAPPR